MPNHAQDSSLYHIGAGVKQVEMDQRNPKAKRPKAKRPKAKRPALARKTSVSSQHPVSELVNQGATFNFAG